MWLVFVSGFGQEEAASVLSAARNKSLIPFYFYFSSSYICLTHELLSSRRPSTSSRHHQSMANHYNTKSYYTFSLISSIITLFNLRWLLFFVLLFNCLISEFNSRQRSKGLFQTVWIEGLQFYWHNLGVNCATTRRVCNNWVQHFQSPHVLTISSEHARELEVVRVLTSMTWCSRDCESSSVSELCLWEPRCGASSR